MKITKVQRWEEYRDFFQLWYIKFFISWFALVPIAHRFLNEVPTKIEFSLDWTKGFVPEAEIVATQPIILNMSLPFSWQILWVASFFFFVAFVIYQVKCPEFVKKYNRYADYSSMGHDPRHIAWQASYLFEFSGIDKKKFINRMLTKKLAVKSSVDTNKDMVEIRETTSTFVFIQNDEKYEFSAPVFFEDNKTINMEAERSVFWEIFGRYSELGKWWRTAVHYLLILNFILIFIVAIQHIGSGFIVICNG